MTMMTMMTNDNDDNDNDDNDNDDNDNDDNDDNDDEQKKRRADFRVSPSTVESRQLHVNYMSTTCRHSVRKHLPRQR